MKPKEKNIRSIVKALSWRFIASCTTIIISYIIIGDLNISLGIGFFDLVFKLILYYFHERIWIKVSWGHYK